MFFSHLYNKKVKAAADAEICSFSSLSTLMFLCCLLLLLSYFRLDLVRLKILFIPIILEKGIAMNYHNCLETFFMLPFS